jgi:hypothetical protein
LRAQARHHRELAMKSTDQIERQSRISLAKEYDHLARVIESESKRVGQEQGASENVTGPLQGLWKRK